ncbi:MaoC/PaaZ C-terminal domain-containing protein [Ramlibacter sp. PS4R-6]|uniref:MaoC/PaaZ C-terminal domain-containing protein n=1 Tax=Ramlibacter sp. PS4R-6 TaxID=3133438 RepID=UPI003094B263
MEYFEDLEVGVAHTVGEFELREEDIIRFASEWDPQPFHVDPEAARRTPMGGITASACHIMAVAAWLMRYQKPLAVIAAARHEFDLLNPARPGDRISKTSTCLEKRPSKSKPDRGIAIFDSLLKTQAGTEIARLRSTIVVARRGQG